jgi:hypothetical protein
VKLSLCVTKHNDMKTYWTNGGIVPRILVSALDEGEERPCYIELVNQGTTVVSCEI